MGKRTRNQEKRMRQKRQKREARMLHGSGRSKYARKRGTYRPHATWWFSRGEIDEQRPAAVIVEPC
jgi:hypothetical protein